ncbi:blastopia polyprotein [Lasius niger]|nr:blastopia polyprotein [Lasius niger]
MQSQVIRQAHENGHFAADKTELLLKRNYWFKGMRPKIEKIIQNCITCILAEKKHGKREGFLNPINKGEVPLHTYHVDHLGPLASTKKSYRHIFVIVDAFSKFVWLYATRTTGTTEVLDRMKKQAIVFGNPLRIILDRGSAFTSGDFENYCKEQKIEHILITTGLPRANGQAERVNRTLIPLLTKLATPKEGEWYKYLGTAQQYLNATCCRSTRMTPFQLLFGTHMRLKTCPDVKEMIEKELVLIFNENRDELRQQAKENILRVQKQNKKYFDAARKPAKKYQIGQLVAIKRTQLKPGLKLAIKFLGPYQVIKNTSADKYVVGKVGKHEGPMRTTTTAEYMKPWIDSDSSCEDLEDDSI